MESTLLSLLLALFSLEGITIRSFIGGGIFALPTSYRCLRSKPSPQCTVDTFILGLQNTTLQTFSP
jgi:hypothetical protein